MKALIVDDEPDIWFLLNSLLRKHKLVTKFVNSLGSAQRALSAEPYGILFLDNRLPDGYGIDFIPQVKTISSSTKIILITGYETATACNLAISSGADYFIGKPFGFSQIETVLSSIQTNTAV